MKIGFYLLGEKGFISLSEFVEKFGNESVSFVVGAHDSGVENDWFQEIKHLCTAKKINFLERNVDTDADIFDGYVFAIGWKWIIKNPKNLIIFHDSLLPRYRGFSPIANMLINGEREFGVTALIAKKGYDEGEIVYQEKITVTYPVKIHKVINEIIPLYAKLVVKTASDIFQYRMLKSTPQDESLATYSLWRDNNDYFINWYSKSEDILRFINAVGSPYKGASAYLNSKVVRILDAEIVPNVVVENRIGFIGKNIFMDDGKPTVICIDGLLKLVDIKAEDGTSLIGKVPFRSRFESKL
jgi:methionyl-tRNA formyltransferase